MRSVWLLILLLVPPLSAESESAQPVSTASSTPQTASTFAAAGLGWLVLPSIYQKSKPTAPVVTGTRSSSSEAAEKMAEERFEPWLDVWGTKTFEYNNYKNSGDFNQFVQNNPQAITDSKIEQHTRVTLKGELSKGTEIHAVFDDSADRDVDDKLLLKIKGEDFEAAAGRLEIGIPGTRFIMNRKKALGITYSRQDQKLKSSFMMARSEGVTEREQFFGQGLQREYLLKKAPVVPGSERVLIDGRELTPGVDYRVDYEGGTLEFDLKLLPLESTASIIVEYESLRDGNAFKNRIFGIREEYEFNGANRIGLSWGRSSDEISEAITASTSLTPQMLDVYGIDGVLGLGRDIQADFELARSTLKQDVMSHTKPDLAGMAVDVALSGKGAHHQFRVQKERIAPDFRSIGRDAFLAQGEDGNLVGDIDQSSARLNLDYNRLEVSQEFRQSRTNLDSDPSKDTSEFYSSEGNLNWKVGEVPLSFSVRNENQPVEKATGGTQYRTLRRNRAGASFPILPRLKGQTEWMSEENQILSVSGESIEERVAGLFSDGSNRFSWSWNYQTRDTGDIILSSPTASSDHHTLKLNFRPSRDFQSQLELVRREEENLKTGENTLGRASGIDLSFKRGRQLQWNMKAREEVKRRIIKEESNLNLGNLKDPLRRQDYVTPTNPVQSIQASQVLRYEPNRKMDHRLSWRFSKEEEQVVEQELSRSEDMSWDMRYRLPWNSRLSISWRHRDRSNVTSNLDTKGEEKEAELVRSINQKWSLTLKWREAEEQDLKVRDWLDTVENEFQVDRTFSYSWRANARLTRIDLAGREEQERLTVGAGVVYTPSESDLRVGLDLERGQSEDRRTKDTADLEKLQLSVQKEIFKDARLEGLLKRETEAPSSKGTGYSASVMNVKVSMDF